MDDGNKRWNARGGNDSACISCLRPIRKYGHTLTANYPVKFKENSLQYNKEFFGTSLIFLYFIQQVSNLFDRRIKNGK